MFILEGVPSVLLGFVVPALPDRPSRQAEWLTHEQRDWLVREMDADREPQAPVEEHRLGEILGTLLSWPSCGSRWSTSA